MVSLEDTGNLAKKENKKLSVCYTDYADNKIAAVVGRRADLNAWLMSPPWFLNHLLETNAPCGADGRRAPTVSAKSLSDQAKRQASSRPVADSKRGLKRRRTLCVG